MLGFWRKIWHSTMKIWLLNKFMMILVSEACLLFLLLTTWIHLQANSKRFKKYNNIVLRCNCALDKQYMTKYCQMVMVLLTLPKLMIMAGFLHLEMSKCCCKRIQFLRKQSLLSVALTSHTCNFKPYILFVPNVPNVPNDPRCRWTCH